VNARSCPRLFQDGEVSADLVNLDLFSLTVPTRHVTDAVGGFERYDLISTLKHQKNGLASLQQSGLFVFHNAEPFHKLFSAV
jgi:hypothetical protein